jgi:arylsulfatase A-like enzyme
MQKEGAGNGRAWTAIILAAVLAGCTAETQPGWNIRLVEEFAEAESLDTPPEQVRPAPVEWRFDDSGAAGDWRIAMGAGSVTIRDGALEGRTTSPMAALVFSTRRPVGVGDRLHEVEIRMRVSAGANVFVATVSDEEVDPATVARRISGLSRANVLASPIVAGPEMRTYRLPVANSFNMGGLALSDVRHVLVRPTDVAGAEFAIESVRVVFRSEHLAGVTAGIGWHGLSEVWRETLVTRAPTTLRYELDLPPAAWLDLVVGTIEAGPLTFEVRAESANSRVEARRTVTAAERWEPLRVDLDELSGARVQLSLTAVGDENRIAFWGSPVVRSSRTVAAPSPEAPPSGVILIVADTLRKDHLQAYGYPRQNSPTLDRMARQGVLFRDPVSQAPWTKASVPSILSSNYQTSHGVRDFNDRLPSSAVTMAELFRDAGYATFATSSVAFSGQLTNLHQGVEVLHERISVGDRPGVSSSKTARTYLDRLLPWIEEHQDVPFFAFLHVFDPHSPFEPYEPFDLTWTDASWRERYAREMNLTRPHIAHPLMRIFGMPDRRAMEAAEIDIDAYLGHEKAWYDGSILAMDYEIERLLETLDRLGLAERTLIAFTSDHGEEFLEHGRHFHGFGLYGEMTGIPLILHWPGRLASEPVEETVESVDILPTLAELAGLEIPETAQGDSLTPLFDGGTEARWRSRPAFSERIGQPSMADLPGAGHDSRAVIHDGWKLIHNLDPPAGTPEFELYDHRSDPLDQNDVSSEHPEIVERLHDLLSSWHEQATAMALPAGDEAVEGLGAEELEQLRALGYLQ